MKTSEWLKKFNKGVPGGFPVLMCGWPDAEHGITHSAYVDNCIKVLEDLDEGQDAPVLGSYKEWVERQREDNEERDNLGFSWQDCEICGSPAGERYAATAFPLPRYDDTDYVPLEVCGDCLCYIANGDVPCDLEDD